MAFEHGEKSYAEKNVIVSNFTCAETILLVFKDAMLIASQEIEANHRSRFFGDVAWAVSQCRNQLGNSRSGTIIGGSRLYHASLVKRWIFLVAEISLGWRVVRLISVRPVSHDDYPLNWLKSMDKANIVQKHAVRRKLDMNTREKCCTFVVADSFEHFSGVLLQVQVKSFAFEKQ